MTTTYSRRAFLVTGATVTGGALLGATAACTPDRLLGPQPRGGPSLDEATGPDLSGRPDGDLSEPRVVRSAAGTLSAAITIATHPTRVAGAVRLAPCTYGDAFVGPTLRVGPGDVLDLTVRNQIMIGVTGERPGLGRPPRPETSVTNVHYHGLHVPPTGTADNMTVTFGAGESYHYRFQLPPTHPAGLFWYHAHVHGLVTEQVGRGSCGMLYVANGHTAAVDATYRRRLLVLQQLYLEHDLRTIVSDDGEREDPLRGLTVVNGELMPRLHLRPGERQVWGVANASTSAFYQLRFPDGFDVRVLAYDGLTRAGYPVDGGPTVQVAPGKRVELDVRAPAQPTTAVLSLDAYFQGVDTWPAKPVATLAVGGAPVRDPGPVPLDPAALPDLSGAPVARRRTIVFDQDDGVPEGVFGRFRMYRQGSPPHAWDPAVPEWTDSVLGTVEEWTILNDTEQEHPFHVHTNPVQALRVVGQYNGQSPPAGLATGYHDTIVVPPNGRAVVRTHFTDFVGGPVLMHCHILDHEDMGMMTSFYIQPAPSA